MSGYVEVMVKGNTRALIEAGAVAGVIAPPGKEVFTPSTAEDTFSIIIRGGDTISGVYGLSPARFLAHVEGVKLIMKDRKKFCVIALLDKVAEFEAELEQALAHLESADG